MMFSDKDLAQIRVALHSVQDERLRARALGLLNANAGEGNAARQVVDRDTLIEVVRLASNTTNTAVCLRDVEGCFVMANANYCSLYGYSEEELLGQSVLSLIPDEMHEEAQARLTWLRNSTDANSPVYWTMVRKDGTRFRAGSVRVRLTTNAGPLFLYSVQDLTTQELQEQQRASLESRAVHNLRLESLNLLAGGIAHDFNNIFTGVLHNIQYLRNAKPNSADFQEVVEEIHHAVQRASGIVRTLQEYTRQRPSTQNETDLAELVRDTLRLLRSHPKNTPSRVRVEIVDEGVSAFVSQSQIQQVILNFMTNALEASEAQQSEVVVRVERLDVKDASHCIDLISGAPIHPGAWALLSVQDQGVGMEPAQVERVFDPFYTTKGAGRGLGLASAAGIIRSHGGAVVIDSAVGFGTIVTLMLPILF